jgi:hypothetical protein
MADPDKPPFEPVTSFAIPQSAQPKAVADAEANFQRLAGEFADCRSQIAEARELKQHQVGQAHAAAAAARIEGGKPPTKTPDKLATEWDAKILSLKAELTVLAEAVDQAGNTMIAAINQNREQWLADLDALDKAATKRLAKAIEEARAAVEDLSGARAAPWWLREFTGANQYPGGNALGSRGLHDLEKLVTPEQRLVAYRDDDGDGTSEPVWEDVVVR